ncbi:hypothetical protein Scep_006369 [Stephania cephalantha]|uniref:Uncharacterized protein n=1 Tax=Stephania cephalantha TaxID=152367 RepID=A0AAP0K822_9MAGN
MPNNQTQTQTQTTLLEEWLRTTSGIPTTTKPKPPPPSARAIIQAWSDLRSAAHHPHQPNQSSIQQSLQTLLASPSTLHVGDPHAALLLSLLTSHPINHLPPPPLLLSLLSFWLRKTPAPPSPPSSPSLPPPPPSSPSPTPPLPPLPRLRPPLPPPLPQTRLLGPPLLPPRLSPRRPASGGHCCCWGLFRVLRKFETFSGGGGGVVVPNVSHGLMILHMIEWVVLNSTSFDGVRLICGVVSGCRGDSGCAPFAVAMAAAGALRGFNRGANAGWRKVGFELRELLEECVEGFGRDLMSKSSAAGGGGGGVGLFDSIGDDNPSDRLLLQCIALGMSRIGPISSRPPLLSCLVSALLVEIFPLRSFYARAIRAQHDNSSPLLDLNEVKNHLNSVLFKEAGAVTNAFCNQYASANDENKEFVENLIWGYCQDVYLGHRRVAFMLNGKELLGDLEKIAEACFIMVVVFASLVTKHRLDPHFSREMQLQVSVKILISFSCIEYFRRVRLSEYTDAIRGAVVSVQENESSCVSFIESMPSYVELMSCNGSSQKLDYVWLKDDVQTARILFYLRVIPTSIQHVPSPVFRKLVAPTMFLYMGHPNSKVARAAHSLFVAFISSGKDSNQEDREILKEQLVFYYMKKSLEGYPMLTPFEGMASGIAALVRHLPAGSPAIFYCIHSLCEKANDLCSKAIAQDADIWKSWQGDPHPCKKLLELLLRLLSLVDIQVLPHLMKLIAQLVVQLPKDGQNLVLDEIHALVAESDDVTRKPTLVSWLQSLSYICSKKSIKSSKTEAGKVKGANAATLSKDTLSMNQVSSRL